MDREREGNEVETGLHLQNPDLASCSNATFIKGIRGNTMIDVFILLCVCIHSCLGLCLTVLLLGGSSKTKEHLPPLPIA